MEKQIFDSDLEAAYRNYGNDVIRPNISERAELYANMEKSPEYAALVTLKALRDIRYFFRYFLWTHEPRPRYLKWYGLKNATVPFILYEIQEGIVADICNAIDNGEDLLIDKSREQGASWLLFGGIALWYWVQKNSGNDFLFGSRKFDNVDKKGATDTLFEKFRYNLYRLPKSFMPQGFDSKTHDNVGFISNPETKSFVRGEANNANFSTSGRYKAIFADEYAKWEDTDEAAWTSMGSATLCRIPVSTPYGMGRKFSQLRFGGATKVRELHWSNHPLHGYKREKVEEHPFLPHKKNVWVSPWYLTECARRTGNAAADIGQELDMDHLTSGNPYFMEQMYTITETFKELEESPPKTTRYDIESAGGNSISLVEKTIGRIHIMNDAEGGYSNRYSISADVAEGLDHGDNSMFYVYDRVKNKDVAWFAGKIDTTAFAHLLAAMGKRYYDAYIAVEANNHGHAVIQELKKHYYNLYHRQSFDKIMDLDQRSLGWHTNGHTKPIMCGKLQANITDGILICHDAGFWTEASTYMVDGKNGKLGAESGKKDDRVIAQAIKWMLHEWLPAPVKIDLSTVKKNNIPRFGGSEPLSEKEDVRTIWR